MPDRGLVHRRVGQPVRAVYGAFLRPRHGHVRSPRHLPEPEAVRVRLAHGVVAGQLRLGVHDDDRDVQIRPDGREAAPPSPAAQLRRERHDGAEVDVRQEPVEQLRQRVYAVDVRAQARRGLGSAGRDQPLDLQSAHRIQALPVAFRADGAGDLGEDVVRPGVAGVDQRAVALRVPRLESAGILGKAVDADLLRGDAHPGIAAQGLAARGTQLEAGGDVQPEGDDRAVERGRVFGPNHQHARLEVRLPVRCPGVPPAVRAVGAVGQFVGGRFAFEEVLLGRVAAIRHVHGVEGGAPFPARDGAGQGCRARGGREGGDERRQDRCECHDAHLRRKRRGTGDLQRQVGHLADPLFSSVIATAGERTGRPRRPGCQRAVARLLKRRRFRVS